MCVYIYTHIYISYYIYICIYVIDNFFVYLDRNGCLKKLEPLVHMCAPVPLSFPSKEKNQQKSILLSTQGHASQCS